MKLFFVATAVLSATAFANAAETKPYVSPTFQDVLSRVVKRETQSKAILSVKAKPGGYFFNDLNFEIKKSKEKQGLVSITLFRNWMNGREICESYLLKPDAAMLQELDNQQKLVDFEVKRQKQIEIESAKRILELTSGQLKRGMSEEDVISLWGKPEPVAPTSQSDHGAIISLPTTQGAIIVSPSLTYPNVVLTFDGMTATLIDAKERSK